MDPRLRAPVLSWGLALLAFTLPLVILPYIVDEAYLLPKQILFIAGIFVWRLLHFVLTPGAEPHKTRRTPTLVPLCAFLFVYLLTTGPVRLDHVVTVGAGVLLLILASNFFRDLQDPRLVLFPEEGRRHRDRPFEFAVAAGVVVAVYALLQDYGYDFFPRPGPYFDWRFRLVATLGNPNHVGGFIALLLPYAAIRLVTARTGAPTAVWFGVTLLLTTAMTVVFTVGAWLGIFAAIILAPVLVWLLKVRLVTEPAPESPRRAVNLRLLLLPIIFGAVFLFYFTPNPLNNKDDTIWEQATASPRWTTGTGARQWIWDVTALMVADRPLTGVGEYLRVYQTYAGEAYASRPDQPHDRPTVSRVDHAHFEIYEVFAVNGLFGGLALLWVILAFLRIIPRSFQRAPAEERPLLLACLLALIITLVHSFASFQWHIASNAFLALLYAARLEAPALRPRPVPLPRRCTHEYFSLIVFLALALFTAGTLFESSRALRQGIRQSDESPLRAEKMFQRAVTLSLGADAPQRYAQWLINRNRLSDAEAMLLEWDHRENSMVARLQHSQVAEQLDETRRAAHWMERVLELNPTWPGHHARLADLTPDPERRREALFKATRYALLLRDNRLERATEAGNAMTAGSSEKEAREFAFQAAAYLEELAKVLGEERAGTLARDLRRRPLDPSTTEAYHAIESEWTRAQADPAGES